jgi:hypothetical protein
MVAVVAAVLALVSGDVHGQWVADSLVGHRVRIHLARQVRSVEGAVARQQLRGTLTRVSPDSIVVSIHPSAASVHVATAGVHQVDVSRGISRSRNAVIQGLHGAAIWAVLGSTHPEGIGGGPTENILAWARGGFIVGAVIGTMLPQERWKRIFRR